MRIELDKSVSAAAQLHSDKEDFPRTEDETPATALERQLHWIGLEMKDTRSLQVRDQMGTPPGKQVDLFESGPVGYFTLDSDGAVCTANITGAGLLGVGQSCLLGRQFSQFFAATDRVAFIAFLNTAFTRQEDEFFEGTLLSEGNHPLIVQIEAISASSGQECLIAMIDTTDRKQTAGIQFC